MWFESPTNPVTKVADIAAITRLARGAGALVAMDNTFAGLHQHGEYDVDVFVHSLTKYASGAGDVLGGAVIGRSELIRSMRTDFGMIGGTLDPHAAYLILRGLKTYFVRYKAQSASAQRVAELLAAHPAVARVHYPGLPSHPQHALARAQMKDFGTIVSFDLKGGARGERSLRRCAAALLPWRRASARRSRWWSRRTSWAAAISRPISRPLSGVTDGTVRLSIGLEDIDDLLADVTQALSA